MEAKKKKSILLKDPKQKIETKKLRIKFEIKTNESTTYICWFKVEIEKKNSISQKDKKQQLKK